jgi:hypothetical protein
MPLKQVNMDRSPISDKVSVYLGGKAKEVVTKLVDETLKE